MKQKEKISYLFFGGCTTLVNIIVFWVCADVLTWATIPSTTVAWVLSVIFAYVTNRIWVFESNASGRTEILREISAFFLCRGGTFLIDLAMMYTMVDLLGCPKMIIKVTANVIVILANYVLSKTVIFKATEE